jgi:hypothetical protein
VISQKISDAVAEMFTVDARGFAEGTDRLLRREGAGLADLKVNAEESRMVVHTPADPGVFIAEIDWAFDRLDEIEVVSLVQIFRMRDGEVVLVLQHHFAGLVLLWWSLRW